MMTYTVLEMADTAAEMLAERHNYEMTPRLRALLRDAILHGQEDGASTVDLHACGRGADRRMTKQETVEFDVLTWTAKMIRKGVDEARAEAGLPERIGKKFEDELRAKTGAS